MTEGLTGLTRPRSKKSAAPGSATPSRSKTAVATSKIVFDNTISPVNVTLFGISIVLAVIGLMGDAVLTVSIVAGNVVVGIFQECRAKRQLDKIALLTRPRASVLRDGEERDCDPNEIVQGDLLIVRPGDQIQADGKVINEEGLSIDEALLTGESDLVSKDDGDEVFAGTYVMQGTGVYEALSVGTTSVAHQITTKARTYKVLKTPLQREVGLVIWVLSAHRPGAGRGDRDLVPPSVRRAAAAGDDPRRGRNRRDHSPGAVVHGDDYLRHGHRAPGPQRRPDPDDERRRVDEPRRRAVPGQDRYVDHQPPAPREGAADRRCATRPT